MNNRKSQLFAWLMTALLAVLTAALADPSTIGGKGI